MPGPSEDQAPLGGRTSADHAAGAEATDHVYFIRYLLVTFAPPTLRNLT